MKYGAVGALALAGAGGAWFVLGGGGGPTVVEDFESGIGDEWNGDTDAFETSTDAVRGQQSGRLAFETGTEVWRSITSGTPSEIGFWWKTGAVGDNEFTVWFHELSGQEEPSMSTAQFGFEVGAENGTRVVTAPPFENDPSYELLTDRPQPDTWYRTRFSNVDYEANTFDVELLDEDESRVGRVSGYSFAGDPDAIDAVYLRNHMNFTAAPAYVDHIVRKP